VDMLIKNEIQVYFRDIGIDSYDRIRDNPDIWTAFSFGLYYDLTFNPVGPTFPATGELNPFSVPRIREAMNYLIDRDYIASEIMGGLAVPRYTALSPTFPDAARYADTLKQIEMAYAYDLEKAKAIISEEMKKLGATLQDGKWYYNGKPVTLKFIIRTEDQRKQIGDYVATQLEKIGFTVERMYMTSSQAAPLWLFGNPADGKWHLYTGGWITTMVSRDESDNFDFFYTSRGLGWLSPLWNAYTPDPVFDDVAKRLAQRAFKSFDERDELMRQALWLSMKDSVRLWVVHQTAPWPARKEVTLTYDLAGGFSGAWLWPHTLRYKDKVGGSVKIASSDLLVEPWNPVGGSDWIYDAMVYRATMYPATYPDPYTGLFIPNFVKKATVYVQSGLPVTKTYDWVDLLFQDEITVPSDAWIAWNASTKKIVTVGEMYPEGLKAKVKVVVEYDEDLWDTKLHDGSTLSLADFVFDFILTFDRGDPASPIYDESYVPNLEAFKEVFKGFKIVQEDPLIIEYYTDTWYLDAEWIAADAAGAFDANYDFGMAPWHTVAIGMLAEMNGLATFGATKADELGVDRLNYIAGATIDILAQMLDKAIAEQFIPYEEVLGNYVTVDEALARYDALKKWYEEKGHFWVGAGPFYLDTVDPVAKIVVLKANREYPDTADRWAIFSEPIIPEISVPSAVEVVSSLPAEITVEITHKGKPLTTEDLVMVKYLLTVGPFTKTGDALPAGDGKWSILLSGEDTLLASGRSFSLTVIAVSKYAAIPASATTTGTGIPYSDYISAQIAPVRAEVQASLADVKATVSDVQADVSDVKASIGPLSDSVKSLQTMVWVAIALAVVSILIGVVSLFRKRS
ncbi:MAG: ABC transporter substrate-binding protein, partial [Thermoprotei archaeon]